VKIQKNYLQPGDTVEVAVTHEIVISGEKSWIKYGVSTKVQPGETAEMARERAAEGVNEGVMTTVRETVETVRKATS
jgi:ribosomal protein L13